MIDPSRSDLPLKVRVLTENPKEKAAHGMPAETGMVIDGLARSGRDMARRSSGACR